MIGMNMAVHTNIIRNVNKLDEASHINKLILGCDDDGNKNGNKDKPKVAITPTIAKLLKTKPHLLSPRPRHNNCPITATTTNSGAIHNKGLR